MKTNLAIEQFPDSNLPLYVELDEVPVAQINLPEIFSKDIQSFQQVDPITEQLAEESNKNIILWEDYELDSRVKETELKWWHGTVVEVQEDHFFANLQDLSGLNSNVEFDKSIVDPIEIKSLLVGTMFTYSISIIDKPTGRVHNTRFSLSATRTWRSTLEEKAIKMSEDVFPHRLLNL